MAQPQIDTAPRPGVPPVNTVHAARDVVTVACKLPNGLTLRGFAESREVEAMPNGTRDITVFRETGDVVVVGGTMARVGAPPPILTTGGYRLTPDVPKDLWDNWYAANKTSDLVRNGLIYASAKRDDAKAFAREHEAARTGLEGIDPDAPHKHVRGIVRADRPR